MGDGRVLRDVLIASPGSRESRPGLAFSTLRNVDLSKSYEGVQEGNIHFAAEHTDIEEQGFPNGAVGSGERVASEVMHQV